MVAAGASAAVPLGMLLAGLLAEWIGLRFTLVGLAACYLLVTLRMLLVRAFRGMDERPSAAARPAAGGDARGSAV
jgi:hypothetical protein